MPADPTIREAVWCACSVGYVIDGSCKPSTSAHTCRYLSPPRTDAVVVTGRTAQDVTRLLREPTDEDIARVARAMHDNWPAYNSGPDVESFEDFVERFAALAIAAYRSSEEDDRA